MNAKKITKVKIGEDLFRLMVFKVMSRDEQGRPEDCTMVPDERILEITGGEQFFTAWVHDSQFDKEVG